MDALLYAPGSVVPGGVLLGAAPLLTLRDAQGDPGAPVPPPQYPGISPEHSVGMEKYYAAAFSGSGMAASLSGSWQSIFSRLSPEHLRSPLPLQQTFLGCAFFFLPISCSN